MRAKIDLPPHNIPETTILRALHLSITVLLRHYRLLLSYDLETKMASILAVGFGVAAAAFIVSIPPYSHRVRITKRLLQGRASLVAYRKSRGQVGALGRAFYKGGFEPRMNRREAALILQLKYVLLE